jgi:trk system potassium uptake protein
MKVIVCGAGQVGWQIVRHLAGEGNDVTIIWTARVPVTRT